MSTYIEHLLCAEQCYSHGALSSPKCCGAYMAVKGDSNTYSGLGTTVPWENWHRVGAGQRRRAPEVTWKQRPRRGESRKENEGKLLASTQKGIGVALALCHAKLSGPSMWSAHYLSIRPPSLPHSPGHSTHVSVPASRPHHPPQEAWHAVGVRWVGFQTTRPCAACPSTLALW